MENSRYIFIETLNFEENTPSMDIENNICKECRICLDSCEEGENKLLNVCGCKGSMKYTHRDCVRMWINEKKGNITCEICKTVYDTNKIGIRTEYSREENMFYCNHVFVVLLIVTIITIVYIMICLIE